VDRSNDCRIEVLQDGVWEPRWWRPARDGWAIRTFHDQCRNAAQHARFVGGECAGNWDGLRLLAPGGQLIKEWRREDAQMELF